MQAICAEPRLSETERKRAEIVPGTGGNFFIKAVSRPIGKGENGLKGSRSEAKNAEKKGVKEPAKAVFRHFSGYFPANRAFFCLAVLKKRGKLL